MVHLGSPDSAIRQVRSSARRAMLLVAALVASTAGWAARPAAAAEVEPWLPGNPQLTAPAARPSIVGVNYHPTWPDLDARERASILDQFAAAGVQWVRIDLGWANLQPTRPAAGAVGPARFSPEGLGMADQRMAEIAARGMKAQVMFYLPPFWSSGKGTQSNPAKNGIPGSFQDYADALAFAAKRWQAMAPVWEIWNEPDISEFWSTRDPVSFAALLRTAYETAKNASPSTTFVSAPATYLGLDPKGGAIGGSWIRSMYQNGARVGRLSGGRWVGSYDQIGIHPYQAPADLPPEAPPSYWAMTSIPQLVSLMSSYGEGGVPLNASEFGWTAHTNTGSELSWELGVTEAQQAAYTLRGFGVLGQYPQVRSAFVFTDRDFSTTQRWGDRFGLLYANLTRKPGYYALKCVASGVCGPRAPFIAAGAAGWRIHDSGADLGTAWRAANYDHGAWRQGRTEIGYGDGDEAALVAANRVTYYFRKSFDTGASINGINRLTLRAKIDDGAVVYLNGAEVWRFNLPSGTITAATRASTFIAGAAESTWRAVSIPATALRTGRNILAVEVHNDQPSSSDVSMDLELTPG